MSGMQQKEQGSPPSLDIGALTPRPFLPFEAARKRTANAHFLAQKCVNLNLATPGTA